MDKFLIRKSLATDAPVAKKPKLRKYEESYLQFGFTVTGTTEQRPQCVLCAEVLANESMKPCKLKISCRSPFSAEESVWVLFQRRLPFIRLGSGSIYLLSRRAVNIHERAAYCAEE